MTRLLPRLARLETAAGTTNATAWRISADAERVRDKLRTMATNMESALAEVDADVWSRMSRAERVAWAMRFRGWPLDGAIRACFLGAPNVQPS